MPSESPTQPPPPSSPSQPRGRWAFARALGIAGLALLGARLQLITGRDLTWILIAPALPTDAATTIVRKLRHHKED